MKIETKGYPEERASHAVWGNISLERMTEHIRKTGLSLVTRVWGLCRTLLFYNAKPLNEKKLEWERDRFRI